MLSQSHNIIQQTAEYYLINNRKDSTENEQHLKKLELTQDKLTKLQAKHDSLFESNKELTNNKNEIESELSEFKKKFSKLSRTTSELRADLTSQQRNHEIDIKTLKSVTIHVLCFLFNLISYMTVIFIIMIETKIRS